MEDGYSPEMMIEFINIDIKNNLYYQKCIKEGARKPFFTLESLEKSLKELKDELKKQELKLS